MGNSWQRFPGSGVNPFAREGWWTQTNGLGGQANVDMPTSPGMTIPVCGVDQLGGPLPYTLTLSRELDFTAPCNCDVRARVEVGAGGNARRFDLDWQCGAQLNVMAAGSIRIWGVSYAPDPDTPYNAGDARVRLNASLGMMPTVHPNPRYTQQLGTLVSSANSAIINPPITAHAVQPMIVGSIDDPPCLAAVSLRWIDPAGNVQGQITADQWSVTHYLPIPAACRVQVHNACPQDLRVSLLWELAI